MCTIDYANMKIEVSKDKKGGMPTQAERRRYPRLQAVFGALAALGRSKFGIITNISRGGLAFRYITFGHKEEFAMESSTISIIYNVAGFTMHNIPCRIIRDFSRTSDLNPRSPIKMTCCIEFDSLTPEQELQLKFFITHFTDRGFAESHTSEQW